MFEKELEEYVRKIRHDVINWDGAEPEERFYSEIKFKQAYLAGAELGYTKANEWRSLDKNCKDLPNEGEWVEGLYLWYYKDEPHWDVFKVRWYHEIGELDEKLVRWYDSDNCWNSIDEPNYWRKIVLPTNSC